jgi:hypothetical protein
MARLHGQSVGTGDDLGTRAEVRVAGHTTVQGTSLRHPLAARTTRAPERKHSHAHEKHGSAQGRARAVP